MGLLTRWWRHGLPARILGEPPYARSDFAAAADALEDEAARRAFFARAGVGDAQVWSEVRRLLLFERWGANPQRREQLIAAYLDLVTLFGSEEKPTVLSVYDKRMGEYSRVPGYDAFLEAFLAKHPVLAPLFEQARGSLEAELVETRKANVRLNDELNERDGELRTERSEQLKKMVHRKRRAGELPLGPLPRP